MIRRLAALFACVLVVMIGFGITLPVMTFYIERLALEGGSTPTRAATHIGLVTAAYPLAQLVFAPVWGRLSDRVGRRPLVIVGILGFAISQALFGVASGLGLLYGSRIIGGALSSALLPAASAYVADITTEAERGRGIAWLNTAVGSGTVIGPALGALLIGRDVHLRVFSEHIMLDGFSVPFFVAAGLAVAALIAALVAIREPTRVASRSIAQREPTPPHQLQRLLGAVLLAYIGISIFEATFTLFAVARYQFSTGAIAAVFTECSVIMIFAQLAGASLAVRVGERRLIAVGFGAMSVGLAVLVVTPADAFVFVAIVFLGAGMAFVGPGLTSQLSKREARHVGAALGLQQAASSLGQVIGAVLGTLLFSWSVPLPYLASAALLAGVGIAMTRASNQ